MRRLVAILSPFLVSGLARANDPRLNDKVTLGLDWTAEAECAGYYQAVATGIHARHGLDVTIQQGVPQVNHTRLLLAIDASIEGWYSYLYSDSATGNTLIERASPEMDDALIAHGISSLKTLGILNSDDALTMGIGSLRAPRWAEFHQTVSGAGVFPKCLDITMA